MIFNNIVLPMMKLEETLKNTVIQMANNVNNILFILIFMVCLLINNLIN